MRLAEVFRRCAGGDSAVAFRAFDGSEDGPARPVATFEIRDPRAVAFMVTGGPELGLHRAYVVGAIECHGDLHAALRELALAERSLGRDELVALVRAVGRRAFRRPPLPAEEAPPRWKRRMAGGLLHSKASDAAAISHHYDVSNAFYEIVLGPSMAYTCACYPHAAATLEEAQFEKFDLVCRKLGLKPGDRLLDVGAGWGGMVMHAAEHYGVQALGVTLSAQQAAWAAEAIERRGLAGRAEVRFLDYRDVRETGFDAISSIGLTEHIGARQLPAYFASLAARVKPEGRLLNHTITRATSRQSMRAGPFIDRYVFPDAELEPPGRVYSEMQDNGFEVRHEENLREHYAMTLRDWGANLEARWDEAVAEVGEQRARVWRLYMAESRVGFELDTIQLHQFLGTRLAADGSSGMPLRPDWERAAAPPEREAAGEPLVAV